MISFHPVSHGLAAGLARARLVRVRADHKQGFRMCLDRFQNRIEPCKHIRKDSVGMRLAGIENDVRKYGHDLFETRSLREKSIVQAAQFGPELNARHQKVTLKTLL